jgi:hypothetical protein
MSYLCPKCSRVIYNRRLKTCGFCGADLPPELLFTAAEIAAMDKKDAALAEEHRKHDEAEREEESRRKVAQRDQLLFGPGFYW